MTRQNISSGAPWEVQFGYSRAVRIKDRIIVSGTIAVDEAGRLLYPDDPAGQVGVVFDRIETAIRSAGGTLQDVVSLRIYITTMEDAEAIGHAFKQRLGNINPVATMVAVAALFADARVEIEAEAAVPSA